MTFSGLSKKNSGFTLVEFVAVIIIASVIAATVVLRVPSMNQDMQLAKNQLLFALQYARVVSLSQATTDNSVVVTLSGSSIDVQLDSSSLVLAATSYPESLPASVTIQNGLGAITFDKFGMTSAQTITFSDGSITETISLSGGGYAD